MTEGIRLFRPDDVLINSKLEKKGNKVQNII
jgi:hypothetical protein